MPRRRAARSACAEGPSSRPWQPAQPEIAGIRGQARARARARACARARTCAALPDRLDLVNRLAREKIALQILIPFGHVAPEPLEHHAGVLDLLIAVVCNDAAQRVVLRRRPPLVIPVDRFELLLQALERAMEVARSLAQLRLWFVKLAHTVEVRRADGRASAKAIAKAGAAGPCAPTRRSRRGGPSGRQPSFTARDGGHAASAPRRRGRAGYRAARSRFAR